MATKREVLMALASMNFNSTMVGETEVTEQDVKDFISTSIEQMDKRAESTAKRQAEKRQAGDELRAAIKATITGNTKTIAEILTALDKPEVTSAMVVSRLTQLVKLGEVTKEDTTIDGRRIKIYTAVDTTPEF